MRAIRQLALVLILPASPTVPFLAQTPPETPLTLSATSSRVVVPVLVRSPSGDLVTNLTTRDFRLTDNGVDQQLLADPTERQPIALVVLMQTGGAAPSNFQDFRTFNRLLNSMLLGSRDHNIALVTFDSHLQQIWNFPPRLEGIRHAFGSLQGGDHGAAILDALNCGIALLESQPKSIRRIVLLLSQPDDRGSAIAPDQVVQVVQRLGTSNTTVYSLTFPIESGHREKPTWDTPQPSTLADAAERLRRHTAAQAAALTGGEHILLKDRNDLDRTLSLLATDFSNTYLLSFHPTAQQSGFHSLQTTVTPSRRHLRVHARSSYWLSPSTPGN